MARGLGRFKESFDAWTVALLQQNPAIVKAVEGSFFNKPIVLTTARLFEQEMWLSIPDDAKNLIASLFACPKTDIVENSFHRLRQIETRGQSNMSVHPRRAWFCAYQQGLLSTLHNFPEAQHTECSFHRAANTLPKRVPDAIFKPSCCDPTQLPLKAIVDDKSQAFWPTFSAGSGTAAFAHLAVWRQAMSNHRLWLRYDQLDMCMLMLPGLIFRPLSAGGPASARRPEDFVLVLGAVERVAVLAWTCDLHLVGSQCLRRPRSMRPGTRATCPTSGWS